MAELVNPDTQTRQITPESGLRYDRVAFIREGIEGETPADPAWQSYSDVLMEFSAEPDPGNEPVHTIGSPDPSYFGKGLEENTLTINYGLQKPVVDGTGEPVDACADALLRNQAAQAPNTHSIYARMNNPSPGPNDADDVSGQRMYVFAQGARADVSIEPDAEDEEPIPVEMEYTCEKLRTQHIWQPAQSTLLCVQSDNDNDTMDITLEEEPGGAAETITLEGTTPVTTEGEYTNLDAMELSEDAVGDVTVHINDETDNTAAPIVGTQLAVIHGAEYYSQDGGALEGDIGVPALGTGSFEGEIGTELEDIQDDIFDFQFSDPTAPEPEIFNITLEVDNGIETYPRGGTTRPGIVEENRNVEISVNVVGERASHDILHDAYSKRSVDLGWELRKSRFDFPSAECIDAPELAAESEQAFVEVEGVYQSRGIQITNVE